SIIFLHIDSRLSLIRRFCVPTSDTEGMETSHPQPGATLSGPALSRSNKEEGLFIQTEQTPNPSTLKFLPGRVVMEKGTLDFANADSTQSSPLAKTLFASEGVERVFFGADFVTVTKAADKDWQMLKPSIL